MKKRCAVRLVCMTSFLAVSVGVYGRSCDVTLNAAAVKGADVAANTRTLQGAIDRAAHCHGTVTIESGTLRTGSLFLKSGITLRLAKAATLLGSQDIRDYPLRPTRVAGIEMEWPSALLNVYQQDNVTVTGEGKIDGDGKVFWDSYWALRKVQEPQGLRWASDYDARRPRLIVFLNQIM